MTAQLREVGCGAPPIQATLPRVLAPLLHTCQMMTRSSQLPTYYKTCLRSVLVHHYTVMCQPTQLCFHALHTNKYKTAEEETDSRRRSLIHTALTARRNEFKTQVFDSYCTNSQKKRIQDAGL